jgi:hypothetical protein
MFVKSQGHQPAPDVLAAAKVDDPQRPVVGRVKEGHGLAGRRVYPIPIMNQRGISAAGP